MPFPFEAETKLEKFWSIREKGNIHPYWSPQVVLSKRFWFIDVRMNALFPIMKLFQSELASVSVVRKLLSILMQQLWEQNSFLILERFQSRICFQCSVLMRTKFSSCRMTTNRRLHVWVVSISTMRRNDTLLLMEIDGKERGNHHIKLMD